MAAGDVGKIESRRLQPYDGQLKKLARALGVPVTDASTLLLDVAEESSATVEKRHGKLTWQVARHSPGGDS
jgi:hypothetical protein